MTLKSALSLLLIWITIITILPLTAARSVSAQEPITINDEADGLRFRLSEGTEKVEAPKPNPVVTATVLPVAETKRLLARLPAIQTEAGDTMNFRLRENSLAPPRAGATIAAAFAPPGSNAQPPAHTIIPLEVSRFAPEGEVSLAPTLSITFSQPMVAVSSQDEAASSVPVTLSPQPTGKWRWLGTQTLIFQPDSEGGRLPMATSYTVNIPAGTKSALGNTLRETKTFTFATPPPTLKNSYPQGESTPRDALMFLEFDQRIDAHRMLEHLKLLPSNPNTRLRLATPEEIAADNVISGLVKRALEGRWAVVRAFSLSGATRDVLPSETKIQVVIPPGMPSVEGPRATVKEQSFTFKTYGPLRVTATHCGHEKRCTPFDPFNLILSNQLDAENFQLSQIKITPDIPDVKISPSYNGIYIAGMKRSNTTYTVTLDRAIKDVFGQTLTGDNQFTFKVNTADPRLFATGGGLVVLDPAGRRTYTVYSVNYAQLKVSVYKVTPDDWLQFRRYQGTRYSNPKEMPLPPGRIVFDKVTDINAEPDQLTETAIDLSPFLDEGYGQLLVKVEPVHRPETPVNVYARRQNMAEAWVQATEISLEAFADRRELIAWANSLKDGRPLPGVELRVDPDDLSGVTGADGLTRLAFKAPANKKQNQPSLLIARRGKDVAILPQTSFSPYYYSADGESRSWRRDDAQTSLSWYVFDDRKLYRPGEEVNIKGWIRRIDHTPTGGTEMFAFDPAESVKYVLQDSQNNEITKGSVKLNALAGFDFKMQLPRTMNLGGAHLKLELEEDGHEHTHNFQVQEFRRPEFEITTRASEAPHFVGEFATVTTTAAYYAGGGLAGTDVDWTVLSRPTNYTPPNRDDFTFGKFYAWWRHDNENTETREQAFKGRTDAEGNHTLRIDFDGVKPPRPSSVTAQARVQDVNRQTLAGSATLLVHPADVYVGLKTARNFVQKGEAFDVGIIVTDLDGKALAGRDVSLRFVRLDYVYDKGVWKQQERDVQEANVKSGPDAVSARLQTNEGGMYRLTAHVRDDRERLNESELSLWVAGGKLPPKREVEKEEVQLIPDRRKYAGGDVAEILVQSPFASAEGVVTIRRSGLLSTERFTMSESSYTLRLPLVEAMVPNVYVQVDLVGAAPRVDDQGNALPALPKRPAFASGEIKLEIPPTTRRLHVKATPVETVLEPGAVTFVDVEVKDASGRSVAGTDTAVIVVDEAVLALTSYRLEDPLSRFYAERSQSVSDYHLRERVKLANPEEVRHVLENEQNATVSGRRIQSLPLNARAYDSLKFGAAETVEVTSNMSGSGSSTSEPGISLRQNFNALAVFAASLPTDAHGRARVRVKLPDNLTRYRVMAVSVAGGKFAGSGESAITARKQLMARPSAPRFLNYGDRAELPVVLQNQTNQAMNVNVAVRASNAELTEGGGRRVTVPANNRVEVRFPIAAVKPGTARFQIAATSGIKVDAAEVSFPVYTPATTEAFATYGVIDNGSIAQPVKAPADAVKAFGGLEITTASTQLQELTDAVIYLFNYPFGCTEQIASRVMGIAALKDVLAAFKAKDLPAPQAMRDSVAADIKVLRGLQNNDGGFAFWRRGDPSFPYVSVHVAHALVRAQSKDFAVPPEMLRNSQNYLQQIEQRIPDYYSVESRRAIQAYALYVRFLMKDRDVAKARKQLGEAGGVAKFSMESLGWLLPVLSGDSASAKEVEMIRRHLNSRVTETAGAAHFADSYSDGAFTILHSNRRADGVILDAMIGDQPQSDLIPKLVRGLLSGRNRGRWTNTQENVFILLALDRYFATYESATPDFVARVWLGNGYAGEQIFKGRSIDRQQLNLPMPLLAERTADAPENLTIAKEGAGRLYFRIGTNYAPANLKLAAADYGFVVQRKYEAIDDPADVSRDPDGLWSIKAGARVRVRLTLSNQARRYHVALVDPLPAGLEALNPELATTERLPDGSTEAGINRSGRGIYDYYSHWRGTWYEHQNMRDERAEAFTSLLWEGVHEYTYFARATTPGLFIVPPTKAEEMYAPETFGRGQSDRVRVR
ncbi:MAG: alpha-2-macroglobulin family protein [Acidobacteriota bacterium]